MLLGLYCFIAGRLKTAFFVLKEKSNGFVRKNHEKLLKVKYIADARCEIHG